MHPFMFLAPVLALFVGQVESTDPGEGVEPQGSEAERVEQPQGARAERVQPAPRPVSPRVSPRTDEPERTQVARAALTFLDALVAGDASRLAAAAGERFSFDGDVRAGKEEIRRRWNGLLAGRQPEPRTQLLDVEIVPASEAISRLGSPPPRLAPLAGAKGTWVAIANVSQRPVVLFMVREGPRWVVSGME